MTKMTDPDPALLTPTEAEEVADLAPRVLPEEGDPVEVEITGAYDDDLNTVTVEVKIPLARLEVTYDATDEGIDALQLVVNTFPAALQSVLGRLFDEDGEVRDV